MSELIKTEAIVLHKIKYGDTSVIVTLFTKVLGKLSAIVKGGRNPKSKLGLIVDPSNYLQIVFYNKDSREVQLISSADIIQHYPKLKSDFDSLKYSQAILELVKTLIPEHEANTKLFNGLIRIFSLMDESKELPIILFARFFSFFLAELGYQLQLEYCSRCGKKELSNTELSYNYDLGMFCSSCRNHVLESFTLNAELFSTLVCLKYNKKISGDKTALIEKAIQFMEKHLKHHIPDFKGLHSLKVFNNLTLQLNNK
ncbi:MAG: DNA repair protein RecO [Ignavibacteriaceae bacterium]|nr:DNA repair protein RecO [Ignavibacteriaceae bacterium]